MLIRWIDFEEPESVEEKIRKKIMEEANILDSIRRAEVRFYKRSKWDDKDAAIYRISFFNSDNTWTGDSYAAVFEDGSIDYDLLN